MSEKTKFILTLVIILIVGTGLFINTKRESDYIANFHNLIIPGITSNAFFIGCMMGSENDTNKCKQYQETFRSDIVEMSKIDD